MLFETMLSGQLLFSALVTGFVYAIVAVGLNLVYGTMKLLNVAHGDMVMLGAYMAFILLSAFGLSPLWSILIVAACSAMIGAMLYKLLFRKLLAQTGEQNRIEANSLLIFFGLSILVQNVTAFFATSTPRSIQYMDDVYHIANIAMTGNRIVALAIASSICIGIAVFLRSHVFGLALRAVIDKPDAARIVGVNVDHVYLVSFMLGFATAGTAGVLVSMMSQFSPFMGFEFSIAAFIVVILGGLGNIVAGFLAALLLGVVETYGVALTSPSWRSVLLYGLFVATLILFPNGLFAKRVQK